MGRFRLSAAVALLACTAAGCARPRPPAPAAPPPHPVRPPAPLPPPPPAVPPTISLAPEGGPPGTAVTVSGRGFPPEAPVSVHVGPPQSEASEEAFGRTQANEKGELTVTFPMPPLALPPDGGSPRTVVVLATTPGFRDKATAVFAYAPAPSPSPAPPSARPSPPVHPMGRSATPQEERAIRAAVMRHLESIRLMAGVTVEVQAVIGRHVRTVARPPQGRGDPAYVLLERGGRGWTVVLGPAASFEDEELKAKGIPPGLWPGSRG
jgi:hypothetical protein